MASTIRPTATNVTVSFGLISFPVDLISAVETKQRKAQTASKTMVCPTCQADGRLSPLRQQYTCSHDGSHGPVARGDAGVAVKVDGELRAVDPAAIEEAEQVTGVRDVIALTVHPAADVEGCTFPSGNIYRLRPRGNESHYGLVLNLAADTAVAFVCEVTNKGATLLYRLVERDGMLVLVELVRPERLTESFDLPDVSFDPRLMDQGKVLVESMLEPFFPDDWVDRRKARLVALAESLGGEAGDAGEAGSAEDAAGDLLELMRRSLDAA